MTLVEELKAKIEKVTNDITRLSEAGTNLHGVGALSSYKEYLEDELKNAENAEHNKKTS